MKLSRYFLPVLRDDPKEAEIVSHRLMLRAGMIRQASAGIYSWLPLGFRVLKKIEQIVREEQNRAGAIELLMPTIQSAEIWQESGRYGDYGAEMLRIKDRHERDMLFGPTNEEQITQIFRDAVKSYRDLPKNLYHIQWKFRDEVRPRFGVMRGREFLMKDAYSFDLDADSARQSYYRMFVAYLRTFARMGLKAVPMKADTGPIGGDLSHEFIILADTGELEVFCDRDLIEMPVPDETTNYEQDLRSVVERWTSKYAATSEMHDAARFERDVPTGTTAVGARHRGGTHLLLRHEIHREDEVPGSGPRWPAYHRARRVLWRGRVAPRRGHHRSEPRQGRHHLAGERCALPDWSDQLEGG